MTQFADLAGLRTVVTGSSSGIGRAIAVEFARGGADVVVHCHRSIEAAKSVSQEVRALGCRSEVLSADLSAETQLADFVDPAWDCYGGIDVWVNNAGADLLTGEEAQLNYEGKLQRLLDLDVRSSMLLSKMVGRRMQELGAAGSLSRSIINVGWDQASTGMEGDSGELFAAAKSAVMGFTRSLAVSLAPQVRVNCIAPGWIRTAWGQTASDEWQQRVRRETPLNRWGLPQDVAAVARFLAAPEASYITGQIINVNGGAVR